MSNFNNGNKNKLKSKEKNSFLNTNYRQKNHQTKFNSIGKLISMNYPFVVNDKNKKALINNNNKNKNNINYNENNNKSKSPNLNNINQNNSKSENDLYSNFSEKDLYGTIQNFSKSPKKIGNNNINKANVAFKEENNQNQLSPLHDGNILYKKRRFTFFKSLSEVMIKKGNFWKNTKKCMRQARFLGQNYVKRKRK